MRPQYRTAGSQWTTGPVYIRATLTSRAYSTTGYALSDLYMTIDQYGVDTKAYLGSFTMVFSRSECGVKMGSVDHRPLAVEFEPPAPPMYPANPGTLDPEVSAAPLPNVDGTLPVSFGRVANRGAQATESTTSDLPPTTTVTSPLENSTASETTTSAPPNPDDEGTSTSPGTRTTRTSTNTSTPKSSTKPGTSTKAPTSVPAPSNPSTPSATPPAPTTTVGPEIVIPTEPANLPASARTEEAAIVKVDEEDAVVVVRGDTVPTDARQGAAALESWLGGGDPGDSWATFTATDPDTDGWRWAAINQKTGTVVYIR